MSAFTIRDAQPERDAAACAAIYAFYVEQTPISFEERAPAALEMEARISHHAATHPWLVAEDGGEVVAYAYACRHQERPAYRWAADVSVYVAANRRREGLGRSLYEELFERLRCQNFQIACAGITMPNDASVGLHEALGFVLVGVSRRIGWKAGAWHDVGRWQLELVPPGPGTPLEPLPPDPPPPPGYH
ncbi:MAG: GCN5-related N-acetyltransferase [Solirubrobacterales bacterium]|nr:GCN5-related N-acetyltransferase [Solirubrobacterales bacterium]